MHVPRAVHACTFFRLKAASVEPLHRGRGWGGSLRFANRLKYQPHLVAGEVARSTGVARALQGIEQTVSGVQVLVEQPQGRGTRGTGAVELRQLGFTVGAEGLVFHRVKS